MKNILILSALVVFSVTSFANTLTTTDLNSTVEPNKKEVFVAQKLLKGALKTKSEKAYKILLDKSRKLLAKKTKVITYNAAIVVTQYDEKSNLADDGGFLRDFEDICYNGDIKTALMLTQKLEENLYVGDEHSIYSIEMNGNDIDVKVMDEFSFSDQDAAEEDREDFIETYSISKC